MNEPVKKERLQGLQFYRGLAAVGVVLFHASLITRKYCEAPDFGRIFLGGATGVAFFFVLSGFVIGYAQQGKGHGWLAAREFLRRRFRRIYIPFWAVCLGVLPMIVWQWRGSSTLARDLVTGLLLLPSDTPPFLGVAWTLVHEVLFYAIFSLVVLLSKRGTHIFVGWQASIVIVALTGSSLTGALEYAFSPLNLLFSIGLIVHRLSQGPAWLGWSTFLLGNLLFVGMVVAAHPTGIIDLGGDQHRMLWAGCFAGLLIYGVTQSSVEHGLRRAMRWVSFLGDASYAIYLIHYPILSIFGKLVGAKLPAGFFHLVAVLVSIFLGYCFHRLIEKPLIEK